MIDSVECVASVLAGTLVLFQNFQKTYGRDIVAGLFMQAALSDPVCDGDPKVAGRFFFRLKGRLLSLPGV